MKNPNPPEIHARGRIKLIASMTALLATFAIALPRAAAIEDVTAPPVPADLQVPAGTSPFLIGHASGAQNYVCVLSDAGFAWTLYGPQATLFDDANGQITTHFLSPNPAENGAPRPTWQHSADTSTVWAVPIAGSTDPGFVAPGAIPWLLLRVVGTQYGPTGGDTLTKTTFIQRVNTLGGIAPPVGCSNATHLGRKALVPYSTDYVFFR